MKIKEKYRLLLDCSKFDKKRTETSDRLLSPHSPREERVLHPAYLLPQAVLFIPKGDCHSALGDDLPTVHLRLGGRGLGRRS